VGVCITIGVYQLQEAAMSNTENTTTNSEPVTEVLTLESLNAKIEGLQAEVWAARAYSSFLQSQILHLQAQIVSA
jgi:hypothetical protein